MDFSYTTQQDNLRKEIATFAREALNDEVNERDRDRVFSRELWNACGARRLPGLPVPAELGGGGLDPLTCAIALEALGRACADQGLVFSLSAHLSCCSVPIWTYGTLDQRQRYLRGLCDGTLIGAQAMTESGAGSDVFALETEAFPEGGGWRLTGGKAFISNAIEADVFVVYALTDRARRFHGGVTAFLVDRDTPGLSIGPRVDTMGLRTASLAELRLTDVVIAGNAVLGAVGGGAGVFAQAMDWERICVFAAHVGQMERLLDRAVAHARSRRVGGMPIGKHQAVAHRIADMKVRLDAARLLTYRAASRLGTTRAVSLDAAIAKLFVSEALVESALETVQLFGASGYLTASGVERALRDAIGARIYSGTSDIQRNIIASWLGL